MGVEFQDETVTAKNEKELRMVYETLIEDAAHEYGHGSYSGTIKEGSGLTILKIELSRDEAIKYIATNAKKWEDTLAIKVIDKVDTWVLGGWYSC